MKENDFVTSVFREIDEELKTDHMKAQWDKYGRHFIAAIIAVLSITIGYVLWDNHATRQKINYTQQYAQVIEAGAKSIEETIKILNLLNEQYPLKTAYLSKFYEAALFAEQGDFKQANNAWTELMSNSSVPEMYRDYARLLLAMNKMSQASVEDAQSQSDVLTLLNPLLKAESAFYPLAKELEITMRIQQAPADQLDQEIQTLLDNPQTPQGVKQRINLIRMLGNE